MFSLLDHKFSITFSDAETPDSTPDGASEGRPASASMLLPSAGLEHGPSFRPTARPPRSPRCPTTPLLLPPHPRPPGKSRHVVTFSACDDDAGPTQEPGRRLQGFRSMHATRLNASPNITTCICPPPPACGALSAPPSGGGDYRPQHHRRHRHPFTSHAAPPPTALPTLSRSICSSVASRSMSSLPASHSLCFAKLGRRHHHHHYHHHLHHHHHHHHLHHLHLHHLHLHHLHL